MSWVRLDDGFIDHPKVVGLGDPAFRLWVSLIAYSCRHHTDGVITRVALLSTSRRIGVRNLSRTRRELVACGLLEELEPTTEGGHILHDFADYQPTAEQVEELRAKRAEAGRLGGLRSAESRNAAKQTKQTPSTATNPVPSRTDKRKPPPTPSATSKLETHRVTEGLAAELAQREARRRVDIRDPDAYAAATARRLLNDRRTELAELVNAHPNATMRHLADLAEHPGGKRPGGHRFPRCGVCTLNHTAGPCPFADQPLTQETLEAIRQELDELEE